MKSIDGHVALIVEDDPTIADILKELVGSLGHRWRHASTLEEVRSAVADGGFCYALLDMQIPADGKSRESVGCGETALRLLRRTFPARNANDKHVFPILVVTSYSRDPSFVSKTHKNGADDFLPKPFGERIDLVLDKVREALADAGREDHAACALPADGDEAVSASLSELSEPPTPAASTEPSGVPTLRLEITGTHLAQRNGVFVNGASGSLPDGHFVVLLSAVSAHLRAPGEWHPDTKLGMVRNRWAPSRILSELKDLLPTGFRVLEANKPYNFRLNPAIVVERVDWPALAKHPQPAVRKMAAEWVGRPIAP
jgi:CheY-like chemotaxis protein